MQQSTFLPSLFHPCSRCGLSLPRESFAGRWHERAFCAACRDAWRRADDRRRHADPAYLERTNARRRDRYRTEPAFADERRARSRGYRAAYPERKNAQNAAYVARAGWAPQYVYQAVQAGKLTKQPCAVCGALKVHAHHAEGYEGEALYRVQWLCPLHHKEAHR